jgi:hypothetical protein
MITYNTMLSIKFYFSDWLSEVNLAVILFSVFAELFLQGLSSLFSRNSQFIKNILNSLFYNQ